MSLPRDAATLWEASLLTGMAAGCTSDICRRTLPNRLCGAIWLGGLVHAYGHTGPRGVWQALCACALAVGLLLVTYALGALAAGDVKYFGALATFIPPASVLPALALSAVAGGLLAACVVTAEAARQVAFRPTRPGQLTPWLYALAHEWGRLLAAPRGLSGGALRAPSRPSLTVPYALALSVGVWLARASGLA